MGASWPGGDEEVGGDVGFGGVGGDVVPDYVSVGGRCQFGVGIDIDIIGGALVGGGGAIIEANSEAIDGACGFGAVGAGFDEGGVAGAAVPPTGLGEGFGAKVIADKDGVR